MKQLLLAALLATSAPPASAGFFDMFEDFSAESQDFMEKWAGKFGPSLEALGPKLDALLDKVDDWTMYELPEVLPNGDIIMRRKSAKETPTPEPQAPEKPGLEL
ncbi:MAG: hypothetical protein KUG74_13955 [Rhodobacteraceae bacterium]|nr:hypothetical protein [Paracoccaceae bacterium]